jgi:hypothetical protein
VASTVQAPTAAPSRGPSSPYFVNLGVDAFVIGGFSVAAYFAIRQWAGGPRAETAWTLAGYLVWVINWPHFSATSYRLYGTRAHLRQYPVTAIVTPFLVMAGVLGAFASPNLVAPYFLKLFLIWSPYHFSGQTIGISLLYARRSGYPLSSLQRSLLSGFVYSTFLLGTVRAEVGLGGGQYFGVRYPTFGLPMGVATAVEVAVWGLGIGFALVTLFKAWNTRQKPPLLLLLPGLTQFVWFVPGASIPNYVEFVPCFHSLQYLLIAWSMQLKEKADRTKVQPGSSYVTKESVRWYILNVGGGALLFSFLPYFANKMGVATALASAVVVAAVQIHHFFVDGVIWKLRSASVVSPLLVNIPHMMRDAVARVPTPDTSELPAPKEAA